MNNKKIPIKTTIAIFLAIVLVTGTIALSSPSFIIKGVEAQGNTYYDSGMDNRYNYYEPDYRMDNNDRKSYGNDNGYKSQYQSYKPDYKTKYPSYGEDNRDKSQKDNSKSVSINKIKCINDNININGNNIGNVNIGNKDGISIADAKGYFGASSYGDRYGETNNGYNNKQDKGFDCIINNNNTNVASDGNQTIQPEPSQATLNVTKLVTYRDNTLSMMGVSIQQAPSL